MGDNTHWLALPKSGDAIASTCFLKKKATATTYRFDEGRSVVVELVV